MISIFVNFIRVVYLLLAEALFQAGLSNFSVVLFPNSPSPWAVDEEEVALEGELHTLQKQELCYD
jgi:hypothetical protein